MLLVPCVYGVYGHFETDLALTRQGHFHAEAVPA
jgi:hypothetical protein